jgi:hypothetical protein
VILIVKQSHLVAHTERPGCCDRHGFFGLCGETNDAVSVPAKSSEICRLLSRLLDDIKNNLPKPGEGVMPLYYIVLVDAAHADTPTREVRSHAWIVTKRLELAQKLQGTG